MKGDSLMAGWNLKAGAITEYVVSEDRIWSLFNFVFSDACKKRNTYKFGLIKSLLDIAFSGEMTEQGVMIIPGLFEPPVRTLRATIPENESHIFR